MAELKVGTHVEHKYAQGLLIVKMVHGKTVAVVDDATAELKVYPISELFEIPGQDYNVLRRRVTDAAQTVIGTYGDSLRKDSVLLALTRQLYSKDVRCGTDIIEHAQVQIRQAITGVITGVITPQAVEILKRNSPMQSCPKADITDPEPVQLAHHTPEGEFNLAPMLSDDELALMCCEVADMIASSQGFAATASRAVGANLTELQRRISMWAHPRGNVRKNQTWEMAKRIVNLCRQAEVDDSIENVLEAIRQQEDPEEDPEDFI